MALVEGNSKATGYGQQYIAPTLPAPAPDVPTYSGMVDDNTAYNTTVLNTPPVQAAPTPVVTQMVPPIWDSRFQTYRDPNSGLLAIGSDATGWQWVTEAQYVAMKPPALPAPAPAPPQPAGFVGASGNVGTVALPSGGTLADFANRGAVGEAAPAPPPLEPEDAYDFGAWNKGISVDPDVGLSDQNAYFQIMHPYEWENPSPYRQEIAAKTQATLAQFQSPYTALGQELLASGAINSAPFWEGDSGWPGLSLGAGSYNLGEPGRARYNHQWIADAPYTPAAAAMISGDVPRYIGSGVNRPGGTSGGAGGMYAGLQNTSLNYPSPRIALHERAHLWDDANGITVGPSGYSASFQQATWAALEDPMAPAWLKAAIEGATARGKGGTGDPIIEAYAHIAEMAAGRMHELPAYMRPFFETLYTR